MPPVGDLALSKTCVTDARGGTNADRPAMPHPYEADTPAK
jgi:hypothetical protein